MESLSSCFLYDDDLFCNPYKNEQNKLYAECEDRPPAYELIFTTSVKSYL